MPWKLAPDLTKVTSVINLPVSLLAAGSARQLTLLTVKDADTQATKMLGEVSQILASNGSEGLALMVRNATRKGTSLTIKPIDIPHNITYSEWSQREYHCTITGTGTRLQRGIMNYPADVEVYSRFGPKSENQDTWDGGPFQRGGSVTQPAVLGFPDVFGCFHPQNPALKIEEKFDDGEIPFLYNAFEGAATTQLSMKLSIDTKKLDNDLAVGVQGLRICFIQQLDPETAQVEVSCFLSRSAGATARWKDAGYLA